MATGGGSVSPSTTYYRSGRTDAWISLRQDGGWGFQDHFGGHTSDSDLWEEEIRADGFLKRTTDAAWREQCRDRTNGDHAYCSTRFEERLPYDIVAKTNHFFHTSGYMDTRFTTENRFEG